MALSSKSLTDYGNESNGYSQLARTNSSFIEETCLHGYFQVGGRQEADLHLD